MRLASGRVLTDASWMPGLVSTGNQQLALLHPLSLSVDVRKPDALALSPDLRVVALSLPFQLIAV